MALRIKIAKNIPDNDNPNNLVVACSLMCRELDFQCKVSGTRMKLHIEPIKKRLRLSGAPDFSHGLPAAVFPSSAFVSASVYFDLVVDFKVSSLSVFEPVVLWPGA